MHNVLIMLPYYDYDIKDLRPLKNTAGTKKAKKGKAYIWNYCHWLNNITDDSMRLLSSYRILKLATKTYLSDIIPQNKILRYPKVYWKLHQQLVLGQVNKGCDMTYFTQLTQSEWAPSTEWILWCVMESKICIDFFSQAATRRDLWRNITDILLTIII